MLKWNFRGIGEATCTHDGVPVAGCTSPFTLTVLDVAEADKSHTFQVTFTDVCGNDEVAKFTYTQKGITAVSQPNIPSVLTTGGTTALPMNNSAVARTAFASLASAAAVAVMLPVLL